MSSAIHQLSDFFLSFYLESIIFFLIFFTGKGYEYEGILDA